MNATISNAKAAGRDIKRKATIKKDRARAYWFLNKGHVLESVGVGVATLFLVDATKSGLGRARRLRK